MKLFIDSGNLQEIRNANATGLVEGIVTDPTILGNDTRGFEDVVREICAMLDGPIAVDAVSQGWEEIVEEGRSIAKLHRQVVVKIPATAEGLRAVRRLAADGVKTHVTHCYSPVQSLLAAKAGATYVSTFVGTIDELGDHGSDVVEKTLQVFNNYDVPTQVVVAGVRSPAHVLEAAAVGADACAVPPNVFRQILHHPLTEAGVKQVADAWKRVPKN